MNLRIFVLAVLLFLVVCAQSQTYSILIKEGHVIDPKNKIDGVMDVAINADTIARIAKDIDSRQAKLVINAKGLYVTPGLIDLHSHNFYGTKPNHYLSDGLEA